MSGWRSARATVVATVVVCAALGPAGGTEADWVGEPVPVEPRALDLPSRAERKADAMATYVQALIDEESEGPDKALESYRRALDFDPANADLAIRLSQDYLRRGDAVQALAALKDALKASPRDARLPVALALIYHRHLGKRDLAIKYAQAAIEANPADISGSEVLCEIYDAEKAPEKVGAVLGRAAKQTTDDPEYWLSLAEITARYAPADAADAARPHIERAIGLAVGNAPALARAGDLLVLAGDVGKATEAYMAAYGTKASLPQLRQKLAACYIESGKSAEAVRILEEIVSLNPLDIEAYDQLARMHLRDGSLRKAADSARQALIIEPRALDRHMLVADLLFRVEDFAAAADTLREARRLFPSVPRIAYFHALALGQLEKRDEAFRAFQDAEAAASNVDPSLLDAGFYFDYGAAAERAGQHAQAARLFRLSIRLDPPNAARAYNYLGYMWVDRNENLEEAGEFIRRALELDPDNGAYIDSLGWLYYRQGKYEDALATLLRAAGKLPEPDAVVYEHIGDAYRKLGRTAEAVLYWQKALGLDAKNAALAAKIDSVAEKVAAQPSPPAKDAAAH